MPAGFLWYRNTFFSSLRTALPHGAFKHKASVVLLTFKCHVTTPAQKEHMQAQNKTSPKVAEAPPSVGLTGGVVLGKPGWVGST